MKKCVQRFLVAVLAAAVMTGCASAPPASQSPASRGKAIVRSVHGEVAYATNGLFRPLKINMALPPGTTIRSGQGSDSYLQVNGFTSTIKVTELSMLELTRMDVHGTGRDADTETLLTVKYGTILYSVRKLSANSRYEVHTPNGAASVRGTDFQVTVTALATGKVHVSYTCVTGQLLVSADVDGQNVTKVLATGQQWVPGEGDVKSLPPAVLIGIRASSPGVLPPPAVVLQQPFNGSGAPDPAVDVGQTPFKRAMAPPTTPVAPPPVAVPTPTIPDSRSPSHH